MEESYINCIKEHSRRYHEILKELAERYCKTHFYSGDKSDRFIEDMVEGGPLVLVGRILYSEGPLSIDDFFSVFDLGNPKIKEELDLRSVLNSILKNFKFDENYKLYITKRQIDFLTEYYPSFRLHLKNL